ncbi:hypothetical protein B0G62_102176 [Paraburkholderia eburnea]|uniref:Uncharacterized protein n=1 Tax=Paraburkholderia eburnea TaxID=1189126 RepID=A0A2S4MIJ1_9BURK|nr:hypothetical protein [Paraburkholderia eburnea]POR54568.1 hypothetical protein B0G62_102176 [Paraburkholderia eburnea]PRZ19783.1 hypothetical protein BX588_114176 [Paraburkholderia eburnea]
MTAGLQIFDASGNIVLDATYRVMRLAGFTQIYGGTNGSVVDSRLAQGGWFAFQPSWTRGDGYLSGGCIVPRFTLSGNTLLWTWSAKNSTYDIYQDGYIVYGGG